MDGYGGLSGTYESFVLQGRPRNDSLWLAIGRTQVDAIVPKVTPQAEPTGSGRAIYSPASAITYTISSF